jgi:alkyl hydroperoxide reductase subunit F
MYDCIIIGAGPAGLTAAIYTARKKLKTLVLSKDIGGQMAWSSDVENYTGFSFITGVELTQKFKEHAYKLKEDLEILDGEEVVKLEKNISSFIAETKSGKSYFSKSVIIATGKKPRMLGIPGEKQFMGKGVAICATCDHQARHGAKRLQ